MNMMYVNQLSLKFYKTYQQCQMSDVGGPSSAALMVAKNDRQTAVVNTGKVSQGLMPNSYKYKEKMKLETQPAEFYFTSFFTL